MAAGNLPREVCGRIRYRYPMSSLLTQHTLILCAHLLIAGVAASHALLTKRDPRSAWGWIAVCWLFPLAGAMLYWIFGVNRIHTLAQRRVGASPTPTPTELRELPAALRGNGDRGDEQRLLELVRIGQAMTGRDLTAGNRIEPLHNGEQAYPAMLEAIAAARHSIDLVSYIYRSGQVGSDFAEALAAAQKRGVHVRVLLDGVADAYYLPRASRLLRRHGLRPRLFLPIRLLPPMLHINLRNHRKLLLVDGVLAFAGGMNIADHHLMKRARGPRVQDLHFRIEGPVLQQLAQVFNEDWKFATGEDSAEPQPPAAIGAAAARVITDGPNEDLDKLLMVLLGAFAAAHHRIWIMTPYFIPSASLVAALQSAALRGVDVSIVLPEKSDQPWINWATNNYLASLLRRHVRVFLQPPPFAHTKLLLIDDDYLQLGSANLDNRSMRLNFELVVEAFDPALVARLADAFARTVAQSKALSLEQIRARRLPQRFRDALCWLFSPYL